MAILVSIGTNNSDERFLTKNIQWAHQNISCDVYDPTDRINPVIILDKDQVDLAGCNYMEIPEFGRKYFITNITSEAGNRTAIAGHVDVLSTYDAAIRNCDCIAARSSSDYNFYLQDNARLFNTYTYNQYIDIGVLGEPDTICLFTL